MKWKISLKLILFVVSLSLLACFSTGIENSESEDQNKSSSGKIKFCLQNLDSVNSCISFNRSSEQIPVKVKLVYSSLSNLDSTKTSVCIDLMPFGGYYISNKIFTLDVGTYELERFDVLNNLGYTIYATPFVGSKVAEKTGIGTTLKYEFTASKDEMNTIRMQVIDVDEDTDPADFGLTDFTFEVINYSKFYIKVLALDDENCWEYTNATLKMENRFAETIKETELLSKINRVFVDNFSKNNITIYGDIKYIFTLMKDGYDYQKLTFSQMDLEQYKERPLEVKLKKIVKTPPYTKLDANGNVLDSSATKWYGVLDNITGLMWEVKSDGGGLHDKDNKYTWYDSNPAVNYGEIGANGPGAVDCTQEFVAAVNAENYLGYSDWRMPTLEELKSIVDKSKGMPTINTNYFPRTMSTSYWSGSSNVSAAATVHAWYIWFVNGSESYNGKAAYYHVRLVRDASGNGLDPQETEKNAEWFLIDNDKGVQRRNDWWNYLEDQWKRAFNQEITGLGNILNNPGDEKIKHIFNQKEAYFEDYSLTNLSGLEFLTNLEFLSCANNQLTSLKGIENLTELCYFDCKMNSLTYLLGIENLVNLESLDCSSNHLLNLEGIENFIKLKDLHCYENLLFNLDELKKLTNLISLDCHLNQITSLKGIRNLTNLTDLICNYNHLTSLEDVEKLINLYHINCENNVLTDLKGLENLTEMVSIFCGWNHLGSLNGIQGCTSLIHLLCNNNPLTSLYYIEKLPRFRDLYCPITDISISEIERIRNLLPELSVRYQ